MTKIYLVENCYGDSNKVYIGKTKNSREYPHKKTYGNQIIYTYIDEVNSLNRKDWGPIESYWLEQFRQWGFELMNKNKYGGSGPEFLSQESRDKKSKSMIGKTHSIETCLKISKSKTNHPCYSNPEIGLKISKSKIGKPLNITRTLKHKQILKNIHSVSITQYDLQGNFIKDWNSIQEAALYYNIQKGHICNNLKGRSKTSNGFIWKYKI